jgi:hypothetical protein
VTHKTGICHLCGEAKTLTFEHVPPRSAYNSFPRFHYVGNEFVKHRYQGGPVPTMVEDSDGAGGYTLCGPCNRRCGRYAIHFIEWAVFWQTALDSEPLAGTLTGASVGRRSRIMKEIAAMMLSASSPELGRVNPMLRKFVWNAEAKGLPEGIRAYLALTRDKDARQIGGAGRMSTTQSSIFSEVSFAPFIMVMTLGGTPSPDPRLVDISYFAGSDYWAKEDTQLRLPVLKLQGFYPGTYV